MYASAANLYVISTLEVLILQETQLTATGTRFLSDSLCNMVVFSSIHTLILDGNPVMTCCACLSGVFIFLAPADRPGRR